jgi:hypothetical protein
MNYNDCLLCYCAVNPSIGKGKDLAKKEKTKIKQNPDTTVVGC